MGECIAGAGWCSTLCTYGSVHSAYRLKEIENHMERPFITEHIFTCLSKAQVCKIKWMMAKFNFAAIVSRGLFGLLLLLGQFEQNRAPVISISNTTSHKNQRCVARCYALCFSWRGTSLHTGQIYIYHWRKKEFFNSWFFGFLTIVIIME